jgi:phosphate-selective porin OprO and OprP
VSASHRDDIRRLFAALDVFLNVNYDKRIQFRFGRFKSPFTYEFWAQPTEALASGEWSVFFTTSA